MHYFVNNMQKQIQLRMYKTVRCTKKAKSYNFFIFFMNKKKELHYFLIQLNPKY